MAILAFEVGTLPATTTSLLLTMKWSIKNPEQNKRNKVVFVKELKRNK